MTRFNRQVGDWIKLRTGHVVVDRIDPRHEGRVEAIRHGSVAVTKWTNGWTSESPIERFDDTSSLRPVRRPWQKNILSKTRRLRPLAHKQARTLFDH